MNENKNTTTPANAPELTPEQAEMLKLHGLKATPEALNHIRERGLEADCMKAMKNFAPLTAKGVKVECKYQAYTVDIGSYTKDCEYFLYYVRFGLGKYYKMPKSAIKSNDCEIIFRVVSNSGKSISLQVWEKYAGKVTETVQRNKKLYPGSNGTHNTCYNGVMYWPYSEKIEDKKEECTENVNIECFNIKKVSRWCYDTTLYAVNCKEITEAEAKNFIESKGTPGTVNEADTPEKKEPDFTPNFYKVSEELAKAHKHMISFDDYQEGKQTREYQEQVKAVYELCKKSPDPEKSLFLADIYSKRLARWIDDYNRNGAACPSVMICGAGNFPTRRKEKQNARLDMLMRQYEKIKDLEYKITHPHGLKFDEIRRDTIYTDEFENILYFEVKINNEVNRIQLFFDDKPSEEERDILKHHAFKWSPRFGAWQRQLTENAIAAVWSVVREFEKLDEAEAKEAAVEIEKAKEEAEKAAPVQTEEPQKEDIQKTTDTTTPETVETVQATEEKPENKSFFVEERTVIHMLNLLNNFKKHHAVSEYNILKNFFEMIITNCHRTDKNLVWTDENGAHHFGELCGKIAAEKPVEPVQAVSETTPEKPEIMRFVVGSTYSTRSATNHDCILTYTVISRTDKTIKIRDKYGNTSKKRVFTMEKCGQKLEAVRPEGKYSMCPVIYANDPTGEELKKQATLDKPEKTDGIPEIPNGTPCMPDFVFENPVFQDIVKIYNELIFDYVHIKQAEETNNYTSEKYFISALEKTIKENMPKVEILAATVWNKYGDISCVYSMLEEFAEFSNIINYSDIWESCGRAFKKYALCHDNLDKYTVCYSDTEIAEIQRDFETWCYELLETTTTEDGRYMKRYANLEDYKVYSIINNNYYPLTDDIPDQMEISVSTVDTEKAVKAAKRRQKGEKSHCIFSAGNIKALETMINNYYYSKNYIIRPDYTVYNTKLDRTISEIYIKVTPSGRYQCRHIDTPTASAGCEAVSCSDGIHGEHNTAKPTTARGVPPNIFCYAFLISSSLARPPPLKWGHEKGALKMEAFEKILQLYDLLITGKELLSVMTGIFTLLNEYQFKTYVLDCGYALEKSKKAPFVAGYGQSNSEISDIINSIISECRDRKNNIRPDKPLYLLINNIDCIIDICGKIAEKSIISAMQAAEGLNVHVIATAHSDDALANKLIKYFNCKIDVGYDFKTGFPCMTSQSVDVDFPRYGMCFDRCSFPNFAPAGQQEETVCMCRQSPDTSEHVHMVSDMPRKKTVARLDASLSLSQIGENGVLSFGAGLLVVFIMFLSKHVAIYINNEIISSNDKLKIFFLNFSKMLLFEISCIAICFLYALKIIFSSIFRHFKEEFKFIFSCCSFSTVLYFLIVFSI